MADLFFERPILNSPYEYPARHWELDESGQPTNKIFERRRRSDFITPNSDSLRHACFLGQNDPYKALKTTLKAEINEEARESLNSDTARPFNRSESGRIAVKVINHLGDEVMKVFRA